MKTKIVYVLISNENDCYLEQAFVSIYSLRLYNPDANLLLLVDEETSKTFENGIRKLILDYVSKLVIVDVPLHYSKQQKSRYIKTSLRSHLIGNFLFIDCDTIINEELKDIDYLPCEIAAVPDCHLSIKYSWMKTSIKKWASVLEWKYSEDNFYFNSGVLFVKDTDVTCQFYEHWHSLWKKYTLKGINYDQPSLAKTDELMGYKICKLDDIWNCQINANGLPFLPKAKIIHYFASGMGAKSYVPYKFLDKKLFGRIKHEGFLSDDIKLMIEKSKSAFNPFCTVIGYDDAKFLCSNTYWLYIKYPRIYKIFNVTSRIFLLLLGLFSKK